MPTATVRTPLKWDVFVANRQGLTRDLPPGKEQSEVSPQISGRCMLAKQLPYPRRGEQS